MLLTTNFTLCWVYSYPSPTYKIIWLFQCLIHNISKTEGSSWAHWYPYSINCSPLNNDVLSTSFFLLLWKKIRISNMWSIFRISSLHLVWNINLSCLCHPWVKYPLGTHFWSVHVVIRVSGGPYRVINVLLYFISLNGYCLVVILSYYFHGIMTSLNELIGLCIILDFSNDVPLPAWKK